MSAGEDVGAGEADWYVEPDLSGADRRGPFRFRRGEARANSLALIITSSLLFILFASALLAGGRAAIGPLFRSASDMQGGNGVGDIVYAMPDGEFCRHVSFDNATGTVTEGTLTRCAARLDGAGSRASKAFRWSVR